MCPIDAVGWMFKDGIDFMTFKANWKHDETLAITCNVQDEDNAKDEHKDKDEDNVENVEGKDQRKKIVDIWKNEAGIEDNASNCCNNIELSSSGGASKNKKAKRRLTTWELNHVPTYTTTAHLGLRKKFSAVVKCVGCRQFLKCRMPKIEFCADCTHFFYILWKWFGFFS